MALAKEARASLDHVLPQHMNGYLQKFRLYETRSNFYMMGRDKGRTCWRVLKIDRFEPSELIIVEDSTTYSENECSDLLKRVHEGNLSTGGLGFVTSCYGIVGFIKFLGPYYMMLITKRKKIGTICGHHIYSITQSKLIQIPSSTVLSDTDNSKSEYRYKKLLSTVDITKDFFFSYSYHVMHSLQKNLRDNMEGQHPYETMFVWNEFLTREIRSNIKSTFWTVALVHGFFKQVKLSMSGMDFILTLIARRSRHYAGTRYLKRGVNEKGRVANDVETEQIVFREGQEGKPMQICSVVQIRGSIPLFWSQESSRLNIKPAIILSKKDHKYEATKLHFENLVRRYGNPIIVLNLIKTREKKPRESILRAEFARAIEFINKDLPEGNRLKFLHWDLNKYYKNKKTNVLTLLGKVAAYAMRQTGFFYCQIIPTLRPCGLVNLSIYKQNDEWGRSMAESPDETENCDHLERKPILNNGAESENSFMPPQFQKGVLRSNCIDCLDRTNVAQYAYGLAALGHQLNALEFQDDPSIDLDTSLVDDLMEIYETMGDTLAQQYGGSGAHNKIFAERRGQWKAATHSQELITSIQRYYSNAYMDDVKQDAINVFLGYYQPQIDKPALWELNSDQHFNVGKQNPYNVARSIKRSLSTGNILSESNSNIEESVIKQPIISTQSLNKMQESNNFLSGLSSEISTCESDISCYRITPSISRKQLFLDTLHEQCGESDQFYLNKYRDSYDLSNFLDVEWLSSSANSCEEETCDRSTLINSIIAPISMVNTVNGLKVESMKSASEYGSSTMGVELVGTDPASDMARNRELLSKFSNSFIHWVNQGETFFQ